MVIFLACSVPITFGLIAFGYKKDTFVFTEVGRPCARGFLIFIPAYITYLILRPVVQLEFDTASIFVYYLLHDNLYLLTWGVVSYLIYYKVPHTDTPATESVPMLAYFVSFYALLAVGDILFNEKALTLYVLFLLPVSRIGIILISVAALLFARRMYVVARYSLILVPFAGATVAAFVPVLFTQNFVTGSIFLSLSLIIVGGAMYLLADRK